MRRLALLLLVLLGACGGGDQPQEAAEPRESRARVVRSGFSIHDKQVGTGAIVRVDGDEARQKIGLRVTFFADGERLGAERDTLPFCPPRTECGWGQTLFGSNLHKSWASIDRVEVEISDNGSATSDETELGELDVTADDERVVVTPGGEEGTVYLVAFDNEVPRSGYSFFTQDGERGKLRYSQRIFPRRDGSDVKACFYPGPIPERVGGPAD
jgi:hypothetical protein